MLVGWGFDDLLGVGGTFWLRAVLAVIQVQPLKLNTCVVEHPLDAPVIKSLCLCCCHMWRFIQSFNHSTMVYDRVAESATAAPPSQFLLGIGTETFFVIMLLVVLLLPPSVVVLFVVERGSGKPTGCYTLCRMKSSCV